MPCRKKTIACALSTLAGVLAEGGEEAAPPVNTNKPLSDILFDGAHFFEPFQEGFERWGLSKAPEYEAEWEQEEYASDTVPQGIPGDMGLLMKTPAKKAAIASPFSRG